MESRTSEPQGHLNGPPLPLSMSVALVQGEHEIVRFNLSDTPLVLGRSDDSNVTIADSSVSGHHGQFSRVGRELFIEDLGSTNGTFVNGEPVTGVHLLRDGDTVQLGSCQVVVRIRPLSTSAYSDGEAALERTGEKKHDQRKVIVVVEIIGLVGGVASDVLSPLANIALFACVGSLVLASLFGVGWFYSARRSATSTSDRCERDCVWARPAVRAYTAALFFCFLGLSVIMGAFASLRPIMPEPDRGVLANLVPALKPLQDSVFRIERKLDGVTARQDEIKGIMTNVREDVAVIAENTKDIHQQALAVLDSTTVAVGAMTQQATEITGAIRESSSKVQGLQEKSLTVLSQIRDKVGQPGQGAALVSNPTAPADLYQNARIYVMRGDYAHAREMLEAYLKTGQQFCDPYQEYAELVKVQDGSSGAVLVFSNLVAATKSPCAWHAYALLLPPDQRYAEVDRLLNACPDYGPGYVAKARILNPDNWHFSILGARLTHDQKSQYVQTLQKALESHQNGTFLRYYLDKEKGIEAIKRLESAAEETRSERSSAPVKCTFKRNRNGTWKADIRLDEELIFVKSIEYSVDGEEFRNTGRDVVGPRTDIENLRLSDASRLRIRYTRGNTVCGPYDVPVTVSNLLHEASADDMRKVKTWFSRTGSTTEMMGGAFMFVVEQYAQASPDNEGDFVILNLPADLRRLVQSVAVIADGQGEAMKIAVDKSQPKQILLIKVDKEYEAKHPDIRLQAEFSDGTFSSWKVVRRLSQDEFVVENAKVAGTAKEKDANPLGIEIPDM